MAWEWVPPNKGAALNAATGAAGVIATRDEFIGWGPWVADRWRAVPDHPVEAIALVAMFGFLVYAHWRWLLRLFGFREKPGPRWPDDKAMGDEVLSWARRRATTTDNTSEQRATLKDGTSVAASFSFVMGEKKNRPVNVLKLHTDNFVRLSGIIVPEGAHATSIKGMDEDDYRAMTDEITLEIVGRVDTAILVVERVIAERGRPTDDDGDEVPIGVHIITTLNGAAFTEGDFIDAVNQVRKGMLIAQAIIRKHVRIEDSRRGRVTAPQDVDPKLSVISATSEAAD